MNVGPAGSAVAVSESARPGHGITVNPEFLFLVNGLDDNNNGWIDEGYDGVDNNLSFELANGTTHLTDELAEWELEAWPSADRGEPIRSTSRTRSSGGRRRSATAREISLPTNVVIDMTSWGNGVGSRSARRFPPGVINPFTGYVDILLYPNGTVVPTTIYSTPSSFGMSGAFFHFWLAERSDVASIQLDPVTNLPTPLVAGQPVYLPVGNINQQLISSGAPYTGPSLQGRVPHRDPVHADGPGHQQRQRAVRQSGEPGQRQTDRTTQATRSWRPSRERKEGDEMIARDTASSARRGITLTEILIAIMILGVGLASLATLFPIGLLRLRDATRYTRTKYLVDSAAADGTARSLLAAQFVRFDGCDQLSIRGFDAVVLSRPSASRTACPAVTAARTQSHRRSRRTHRATGRTTRRRRQLESRLAPIRCNSGGYGLPFAYDPLWRYQTVSPATGHERILHRRHVRGPVRVGDRLHPQRPVGRRASECPWLAAAHQFQPAVRDQRRQYDSDHADLESGPQHLRLARGRGLGRVRCNRTRSARFCRT